MIKLISIENIAAINTVADLILKLVKSKKFFFTSAYSEDVRLKSSHCLFELSRALEQSDHHCMKAEVPADLKLLNSFVAELETLLTGAGKYHGYKLKEYAADLVRIKICRELVSSLENLFTMCEIEYSDIENVYQILGKPVSKKYMQDNSVGYNKKVYAAISIAIREKSEPIKGRSITHYAKMVRLVDPNDETMTRKAFFNKALKSIRNYQALRFCIAYKFDRELFFALVDDEFERMIKMATATVSAHYLCNEDDPKIDVKKVSVGNKGLDIKMSLNGVSINARAIPVNGYYVCFHYRYIVT
ncbi:MAG: hypothetical protein HAW67_03505 [Endozoicomonadaceae bacterium]|nr:hypothetical protein [Endozoicomonadaceae bacterium]